MDKESDIPTKEVPLEQFPIDIQKLIAHLDFLAQTLETFKIRVISVFERFEETQRNARAYGYEVGFTGQLIPTFNSSPNNPFLDPNWADSVVENGCMICGPTDAEDICACGCTGFDERCSLYLKHYVEDTQVPVFHTCCKIPGRE
jgi:hypothetical protein